tara:strand:+ start:8513 stop:8683 length:171 start_codon:yes stop_codon:yes gene_type:complete
MIGDTMNDEKHSTRKENLIKENLRRAFDDKATEELPSDLLALLAQLRGQDNQNDEK